jgi:predicted O-methyltransferase YrrM
VPQIYHCQAEGVQAGAQHVFIAMPCGGPVDPGMLDFLWGTATDLAKRKIAADFYVLANNCHVDDARNQCVHTFLETHCTDFFFIDSDTVASHDAVGHLLSYDRDVIAGLYPYKGDLEAYPVRLLADTPIKTEEDGAVEVQMVPTGFLRIRRHVIEKMVPTVPGYFNKEVVKQHGHQAIPQLFNREIAGDGTRWGGDYSFCRKWMKLGGKIYIDPTLHFRHYGMKAYSGSIGVHWAKQFNTQTPAFDHAIAAIRAGDESIAHFGRLVADWGNLYCAPPEMQAACYAMAAEAKGAILETGSGLSTILLGLAAEKSGVRVYALEHDVDYYKRTIAALQRYKINSVRLLYVPLRNHGSCLWYEMSPELPDAFAMVVCDGPQRRFGRSGLHTLLADRIAGAAIVMDDVDEPEHVAWFTDWAKSEGRTVHVMDTTVRPFAVSPPPQAKAA